MAQLILSKVDQKVRVRFEAQTRFLKSQKIVAGSKNNETTIICHLRQPQGAFGLLHDGEKELHDHLWLPYENENHELFCGADGSAEMYAS